MFRPRHVAVLLVTLLLTAPGFAQDKEKIKFLMPTHKGSTGLFNLSVADTLRQGEFSIGLHGNKFHREPGDLEFLIWPVSFTVGLHDRIELFGSWEANKRVDPDFIREYKIAPNGPLVPSVTRNGITSFYNDTPFLDVGWAEGAGDFWAGMKFNLMSERYGNPFGLALQPIARFHLTDDREYLARGLTSGATDAGFDVILSKNVGWTTLTGNVGTLFADDLKGVDRQHRFNYGLGLQTPLFHKKVHSVTELVGSTFYGSRAPGTPNPASPLDIYSGLRVFPAKWLSLDGAFTLNLKTLDPEVWGIRTGRWGWYASANFSRKINRPPTIECSVDKATVIEGDPATVRVNVMDEDDDVLTVSWKTSGGRLTQQESSAVFDSTGLTPGRYTVTAEVTDGEGATATCTSDITVEKRKIAPTITCQPGTTTITEGESATLRASASDANNDPLTYTWTVDGQPVTNNSPEFVFGSTGRAIGNHTVRVTVTDVDQMTASCEFTVTINRRPNQNPTVSLTLDKSEMYSGDTVTGSAQGSDPDNDPLTYSWTVDGQTRSETGPQIQINTSGMAGGSHTVAVTVRDDRNGTASDTKSFSLREKVVIPINRIRPDNVAKARLDEIALKLQQDPRLRAAITGYNDDRGRDAVVERTALRRAEAARDYLVKQHKIDAARIETKSGGKTNPIADNATEEGRRQNRRVEIELFVP